MLYIMFLQLLVLLMLALQVLLILYTVSAHLTVIVGSIDVAITRYKSTFTSSHIPMHMVTNTDANAMHGKTYV